MARLYAHWLFIELCLKEDVGAKERFLLIQSLKMVEGMLNDKLEQVALTQPPEKDS